MIVPALILTFIITIFTKVPVAIALGFSSLVAFLVSGQYPLMVLINRLFSGMDSFVLISIPMFILMARIMNESGSSRRMFNFANSLVGHWPGGLGHTNVLASVIFAGMSGSSAADAAGLGRIEIESMNEHGYDPAFSGAITAASSVIGPIIPPSIPMVVYGTMSGTSVVKLFAGGFLPGLLLGLTLMIIVYIIAKRTPGFPIEKKANLKERWIAFKDGLPALVTIVIILGGIFTGLYTPTEASVIAVLYVFFLDICFYHELKLSDYGRLLYETALDTGMILIIIACANAFGWLLAVERIPSIMIDFITQLNVSPLVVLLLINAVLLFLGCFIEGIAILVILTAVLLPIVMQLGYNPVYFGVLAVLNVMIGVVTPPMGMSLFITSRITNIPVMKLSKALLPFYVSLIGALLLCIFFPDIILFLPNLLFK